MSDAISPFERVQQKALEDAEFRAALVADPRAAMKDAMGIVVPATVEIAVVQNTAQQLTLVLPHIVDDDSLEFEELDEVVGFSQIPEFSRNVSTAEPPLMNSFHNANFSKNFAPMGDIGGLRMPPPG